MRLICPSCFAMHSLEALTNDPVARQVFDVLSKLPGQVASRTPAYMALFRTGKNGLSWSRALKIITQIQQLVSTGTVRFKKEEERPAPLSLWAEAMDVTIDARPDAPKDHQYLIKVAWTNAATLAAQAERKQESSAAIRYFEPDSNAPKKRSCWTCMHKIKAPKNCIKGKKPIGGNDHLGCDKWEEKIMSAGDLAEKLVAGLQNLDGGR